MTDPSDVDPPPSTRRQAVVRSLLSLAVVLAIFAGVLPRVADVSDVWAQAAAMTGLEVASLLALACWNLFTYVLVYVASLPGLGVGQAAIVTQASTAIANTVPGGAGFGIGITWAMFSAAAPQYWQRLSSRANTARRFRAARVRNGTFT